MSPVYHTPIATGAEDLEQLRDQRDRQILHLRQSRQDTNEQLALPLLASSSELAHEAQQLKVRAGLHGKEEGSSIALVWHLAAAYSTLGACIRQDASLRTRKQRQCIICDASKCSGMQEAYLSFGDLALHVSIELRRQVGPVC